MLGGNGKQASDERKEGEEPSLESLLEQEKKRSDEFLTKLKYLQADLENYRKRTGKEMKEAEENSVRGLVVRLLSVLDELELAIKNAKSEEGDELLEGVEMVYKNLNSALEAEGLRRIRAVGSPFDPRLHEAVEKVQGSEREDMVVGEIRAGFIFRDQLIRPSMVKVELASKAGKEQGVGNDE